MSTWLDQYKASLDDIVARKKDGVAATGSNDLASAYKLLAGVSTRYGGSSPNARLYSSKVKSGNKGILSSAFNAGKSGGSRLLDIFSRGMYASANTTLQLTKPGPNSENFAEAFWKGLSGQEKSSYIDVYRQNYPNAGKKTSAIGGFLGDVFLDPTTYVGAGLISKIARIPSLISKGGKEAKAVIEAEQVAKGAVGETGVNDFIDYISKQPRQGPSILPENAPYDVKNGSTLVDAVQRQKELNLVQARARVSSINDQLTNIPTRRYGKDVSIAPPYQTTTKDIIEETPFKAPDSAPVKAGKREKPRGLTPENARANAAYQYLLSNPNYQIGLKMGNRDVSISIEKLRQMAKANPERAAQINTRIAEEARAIARGDVTLEPRILSSGAKVPPVINLKNAKGEKGIALTIDQMTHLLEKGEIPKGKGADFYYKHGIEAAPVTSAEKVAGNLSDEANSILSEYPLFEKSDLDKFFVSDFAGNSEPIGKFLERLGVKPRIVDPAKAEVAGIASAPTITVKKVVGQEKTFSKMTAAQKKKWIAAHQDILDPEDINTLLSVKISTKSDAAYIDTLQNKILSRKVDTTYSSIDDLLKAVEDGRVDPKDLQKLLTLTGAKTFDELKTQLTDIIDEAVKAEKALKAEQDEVAKLGKMWETNSPTNLTTPEPRPTPVKPAEAIIRDIIDKGDVSDTVGIKSTLDPQQITDLKAMASFAVQREILDPADIEKYPFLSGIQGTRRTASRPHEGLGRNNDWNMKSQYTTFKGIVSRRTVDIAKAVKSAGLGEKSRAVRSAAMYDHVMPISRAFDKILVENGIAPTLLLDRSYILSLTDVLDSMPRSFVEKHMFDRMTTKVKSKNGKAYYKDISEHIPPTIWNHIGGFMMDFQKGLVSFSDAKGAIKTYLVKGEVLAHGKGKVIPRTANVYHGIKAKQGAAAAEKYVDDLAQQFMDHAPVLAQTLERNLAKLTAVGIDGAKQITDEVLQHFATIVTATDFIPRDLYRAANELDTITESVARSVGKGTAAKAIAKEDIAVKTAEVLPPEVMAQAHIAKEMATAVMSPKGAARVTQMAMKQLENEKAALRPLMDEIPEVDLTDINGKMDWPIHMRMLRAFAPHLRNQDVRPFFVAANSAGQTVARNFARAFSEINKNHTQEAINAAWRELQHSTQAAEPTVRAAQDDMRAVVGSLFNDGDLNWFSTTGVTPEQLNSKFAHYGIHEKYLLPSKDYMTAWKSWDTDNPLDLLSRMQAAMQASVMERTLGAHLSSEFGTKTAGAGLVKISPERSVIGKYLASDTYFPKEIAEQLSVLDHLLKELQKPIQMNKALNLYDHVLHMLKAGLTIYRPGHHIRNQVGDMWFSWMDGVNTLGPYRSAMQVIAANQGRYKDLDALTALSMLGTTNARQAGEKGAFLGARVKIPEFVAHSRIGGKKIQFSPGDIYRAARQQGLLPDYSTLEDIGTFAERQMRTPHLPGPLKGKAHKAAASFSEGRDHFTRLAHFIDVLNKGNFKTLEEAFNHAGARVRKWHPDGSDLTQFEKKVARRSILFYSWQRKAIPLVFDSLVHKPGKVLVFPKATYALAEANGIDLNSLSDPFPADQLFPDWLRDQLTGPQFDIGGQYWGINPGIPAVDVLNDYANSPSDLLKTLAGSATPMAKVPLELGLPSILGTRDNGVQAYNLKTGAPAKDLSDYLDQNTPMINTIANVSNRSVFGLGQPTGVGIGSTPDEIQKAAEKNNPGLDVRALLNLLLGASATNMSTPSVIKSAEFDQRNAIRKAKENASR